MAASPFLARIRVSDLMQVAPRYQRIACSSEVVCDTLGRLKTSCAAALWQTGQGEVTISPKTQQVPDAPVHLTSVSKRGHSEATT